MKQKRNYVNINGFNVLVDIRGKKFGRLTAIEPVSRDEKRHQIIWKFVCECGNTVIKPPYDLMSRANPHGLSCGCLQREWAREGQVLSYGLAAFNFVYGQYKGSAKRRGLSFTLSEQEFFWLTGGDCYYCGGEPSSVFKRGYEHGEFVYNGIDRKDNTLGYTIENCVSCCKTCNYMKGTLGEQEFLNKIKQIFYFRVETSYGCRSLD